MPKPWYKTWWGVIIIFFLALALIFLVAFGFYVYDAAKTMKKDAGVKLSDQKYPAADGENHYRLGAANAPVTIVEFGDFACPYSEKSFPTIREISLKYKNQVKFIWRDYPVVAEYSALLALAGRCAGEQGLFWPMHDKLFQYQGVNSAAQLSALAAQVSADTARFDACMNNQKYLTQIEKDLTDGQSFGNSGTPTWFINGYKIEGDIPYDTFTKIIESFL